MAQISETVEKVGNLTEGILALQNQAAGNASNLDALRRTRCEQLCDDT
jgi:hypothetical protein